MRVITQLIQHFWKRRDLSTEQAAYLVDQGFVRAGDLEGFEMPPEIVIPINTRPAISPPNELESLELELVARATAPKRGSGKSKGAVLTEKQLVAAVDAVLDKRATELEALANWKNCRPQPNHWFKAITVIQNNSPREFEAAIADGFRRGAITIHTLWTALDIESLYQIIDKPELHGPVVRAFQLLLDGERPMPKPKKFLLKHDSLKAARALVEIHGKLLVGLMGLLERQPRLLAAALGKAGHPVAHWALTLVYNARRKPFAGPVRPKREYGPLPLPDKQVWRPAWSAALRMDPQAVTQLLVHCYADAEARDGRDPLTCSFPFHNPRTW